VIEIHRRTGYLLLATLVAQVILISAQVRTSAGTRVLQAVTFGVFSEVQLGTAWVFGGVRSVWDGYIGLRGAHLENQRLREALADSQVRLLQTQAMAMRGAELEKILDLRARTPLRTVAASVIAGEATGVFRMLTIDKGSSSGLRKDMAVIAPNGIVGRIVEPPPLYAAKVQLIIDREAAAGAVIARTGVGGVVTRRQPSKDDDERHPAEPELEMDFVSNLSDAKVGDRVVTSGLDGIFPRGITIGWIASVGKGHGLYKDITVWPAVDFSEVGAVLVVLDPPQSIGPSPTGGTSPTGGSPTPAPKPPVAPAATAAPRPTAPAPAPRPAPARPSPASGETAPPTPSAVPPPTEPAPTTPNPPGARR
jgi:rod shape-determining protein MreC